MSVHASSYVWAHAAAKGTDFLVLLALAEWADDNGVCWYSVERIAARARIGVRGVQKVLDKLARRGLIRVARRKGPVIRQGPGSGQRTNLYEIRGDWPEKKAELDAYVMSAGAPPSAKVVNSRTAGGEQRNTKVVNNGAKVVNSRTAGGEQTSSPDPSVDPSNRSVREPPGGTARARARAAAEEVPIDEVFVAEMTDRFGDALRRDTIRDRVAAALNWNASRPAQKRWLSPRRGVINWLIGDVDRLARNGANGARAPAGRPFVPADTVFTTPEQHAEAQRIMAENLAKYGDQP